MLSSVKVALLIRLVLPAICSSSSEADSLGSSAMLTILIADGSDMKGSVVMAAILSPRDRATALQGCLYAYVYKQSPVSTSHIFVELSAEAVIKKEESPVFGQVKVRS